MYLLYLDESGNENDPVDRFFVLGGIALFERQTFFLVKAIEAIQEKFFPNHQPIPLHASEMRSGRDFWRRVAPETRQAILQEVCNAIAAAPAKHRLLFAAAVEKTKELWGEGAVEKQPRRSAAGSISFSSAAIMGKTIHSGACSSSPRAASMRAKIWVRGFHQRGTSWGAINNLADIPYFAAMKESRLLQVADFVAHAVWLLFERPDASLVRRLLPCFDQKDGILHGLVHVRTFASQQCDCPACHTRRKPGSYGPWI